MPASGNCGARSTRSLAAAGPPLLVTHVDVLEPVQPVPAFGGRKGSSYGTREQGRYAVEFYTTVKTAYTAP